MKALRHLGGKMPSMMPKEDILDHEKKFDFFTDQSKLDIFFTEAWMELCWQPHNIIKPTEFQELSFKN